MRNLTQEEILEALDDNGEADEGCVAIEATVQELADLGTGTCCGQTGNKVFKALFDRGYKHRKCRGWFLAKPLTQGIENLKKLGLPDKEFQERAKALAQCLTDEPVVMGMFHIRIQTDKTAENVEWIAGNWHGSLRYDGDSLWKGFKEFEIE